MAKDFAQQRDDPIEIIEKPAEISSTKNDVSTVTQSTEFLPVDMSVMTNEVREEPQKPDISDSESEDEQPSKAQFFMEDDSEKLKELLEEHMDDEDFMMAIAERTRNKSHIDKLIKILQNNAE